MLYPCPMHAIDLCFSMYLVPIFRLHLAELAISLFMKMEFLGIGFRVAAWCLMDWTSVVKVRDSVSTSATYPESGSAPCSYLSPALYAIFVQFVRLYQHEATYKKFCLDCICSLCEANRIGMLVCALQELPLTISYTTELSRLFEKQLPTKI